MSSASDPSTSSTVPRRSLSLEMTGVPYTMERHEMGWVSDKWISSSRPLDETAAMVACALETARWPPCTTHVGLRYPLLRGRSHQPDVTFPAASPRLGTTIWALLRRG